MNRLFVFYKNIPILISLNLVLRPALGRYDINSQHAHLKPIEMNTELMNEFYLLQESRSNAKYLDILEERICSPIQEANHKMTSWMHKREKILMKLEIKALVRMSKIRKKFLK